MSTVHPYPERKEVRQMSIPRMRTAEKCLEEIKKLDPETELTVHYIRELIRMEFVPVVYVGRKKLVDVDQLIQKLGDGVPMPEKPVAIGQIRRVV